MMGSDNFKFAKPEHAKWQVVRRDDDHFQVRRPDGTIYGDYQTLTQAAATASARQREDDAAARRIARPCLCCQRLFQSEGIHNRLCDICRHKGDDRLPCGVASATRGGRKPAR